MDRNMTGKLAAEFVGTFALIFMGVGAVITASGIVGVAFAHGLAIALMVTALGHISGGVFNPAVAIALWVTRRLPTVTTVLYIVAELLGAAAAGYALMMFPGTLRDVANGVPTLSGVTFVNGVAIEAILTFFLVLAKIGRAHV